MLEAFVAYLPELIGGIIIAVITFFLTRLSEKAKAREELEKQRIQHENEKDKLVLEYDAKIREQELRFAHDKELLLTKHEQEMEKYTAQTQDQELRSIFTGEYDLGRIGEQMEEIEKLTEKMEKLERVTASAGARQKNHPATRRNRR